jgi:hypothetical protein
LGLRNSSAGPRWSIAGRRNPIAELKNRFAEAGNAARSAFASWKRHSRRLQHV